MVNQTRRSNRSEIFSRRYLKSVSCNLFSQKFAWTIHIDTFWLSRDRTFSVPAAAHCRIYIFGLNSHINNVFRTTHYSRHERSEIVANEFRHALVRRIVRRCFACGRRERIFRRTVYQSIYIYHGIHIVYGISIRVICIFVFFAIRLSVCTARARTLRLLLLM